MPFLGKDWRSCGDEWIKTEQGWERIKVLECILDNLNNGFVFEIYIQVDFAVTYFVLTGVNTITKLT